MKTITPLANRSDYTWEFFAPLYQELLDQSINNDEELIERLSRSSKLDAFAEEAYYRNYIASMCNLLDENLKQKYDYMTTIFSPENIKVSEKIRNKLLSYKYLESFIAQHPERKQFFRKVKKEKEMYREENIELGTKDQLIGNKYSTLNSEMMIKNSDGEDITLQQGSKYLFDIDRDIRKSYYEQIVGKRQEYISTFDEIMDELLSIRNQVAKNAGYDNYVAYIYDEKGRFDYGYSDVLRLCQGIKTATYDNTLTELQHRAQKLGVEKLQPYDLSVDVDLKPLLKYGNSIDEMIQLGHRTITKIQTSRLSYFNKLHEEGNFDLESRKGKRGGGFSVSLGHSRSSFILMNASEKIRDFMVLMHEFGHSLHSFMCYKLPNNYLANYPIEIAEVASMSMECFALEELKNHFNDEDYRRFVKDFCEDIIGTLRHLSHHEEFQSRLYTSKNQTAEDRTRLRLDLHHEYSTGMVDWSNYQLRQSKSWQANGHIFRFPFYNIEYAFAQLAAVQFWMQYRENKENALKNYENLLSSGYTKNISDTYALGGVKFVIEQEDIEKIVAFVIQVAKENS